MVITTDCQEIMRDVFSFFSPHKNVDNSVFAFVVWKIYLMACLLSLCSCNRVFPPQCYCLEASAGSRWSGAESFTGVPCVRCVFVSSCPS